MQLLAKAKKNEFQHLMLSTFIFKSLQTLLSLIHSRIMNIREELLRENSQAQAKKITAYIGADTERFATLMTIFLHDSYRLNQRAAWVVNFCAEAHPNLFKPYLGQLIGNLRNDVHDAVKRNTIRMFQNYDVPDEYLGELADCCFEFLASNQEPIAIKVFSMTVLANIVEKYPELKNELKLLIEDQLPYGSAGFKNRGKKILLKWQKEESQR